MEGEGGGGGFQLYQQGAMLVDEGELQGITPLGKEKRGASACSGEEKRKKGKYQGQSPVFDRFGGNQSGVHV